jgi:hypothetical protein
MMRAAYGALPEFAVLQQLICALSGGVQPYRPLALPPGEVRHRRRDPARVRRTAAIAAFRGDRLWASHAAGQFAQQPIVPRT